MPDAIPATAALTRVAIIGAGVIGTSVATACAEAGCAVVLIDRRDKHWQDVLAALAQHRRLSKLVGAPMRPPGDIRLSTEIDDVDGASMIIENVTESVRAKQTVYDALGELGVADTTIAANTSAISIARLAALAPDPTRVVGVHFMNPVPRIHMVEVIRGPLTSAAALADVQLLLAVMKKTAVIVNDAPGFVINRVLMVMINQAAQLVADGVATATEIDRLFKGCLGHAMGPLRTADLIGIDTVVNTLDVLAESAGASLFEPARRLREMVHDQHLGMKTGRGFYGYTHD